MRISAFTLALLIAAGNAFCAETADEKAEKAEKAVKAFAAAEAKMREGKSKDAVALYRGFVAKFQTDKRCAQARYTCAFLLHKKLDQVEEARAAYQEVIKHHPKSAQARNAQFHIAESYEQAGDEQKALVAYEEFVKSDTDNTRANLAKRKIESLRKRGGAKVK